MTRVVALIARGDLRRGWRSLLALALIVGFVGAVVLATAAGARRTASVLDRATEATGAHDIRVQVDAGDQAVARVADALEASPVVEEVTAVRSYVLGTDSPYDITLYADEAGRLGHSIDRPLSVDGRLPAPDAPDEVAVNGVAADALDLGVGDTFSAATFTPAGVRAIIEENRFTGLHGPRLDLQVVGVLQSLEDLQGAATFAGPLVLGSAAFTSTYQGEVGGFPPVLDVRTTGGAGDVAEVRRITRAEVADGTDISTETAADSYRDTVQRSIDAVTVGLLVVTGVAGVVGLLVVGQALSRQIQAATANDETLQALGLDRRSRMIGPSVAPIGAVLVGVALGVVGSIPLTQAFPVGLAGRAESDPGMRVDPLVLLLGSVVFVLAIAGLSFWRAARRPKGGPTRPSRVGSLTRALNLPAVPSTGVRLALDPGRGRTAVPVRSALVGATVGILGLVGAGVVAASITSLVDDPGKWGWTWSATPDMSDPTASRRDLRDDERLEAAALLDKATVILDGEETSGYALRAVRGDTHLTLLDGRAPATDTEVALGRRTADALGVSVGDQLPARAAEGDGTVTLDVVGEAIFPIIDNPAPGQGALFTPDGLDGVRASDGFASLLLTYPDGADTAAIERHLTRDAGLNFSAYSRPNLPGDVANLEDVRPLAVGLGVFFALVAVVGLGHALAVSVRRRRTDFALLRAVGFRPGQVRTSVGLQSVTVLAVGLAVGIPAGLVAGRLTWRLMVGDIGVVDDPVQPWAAILALLPLAVLLGLVVAAVPAWRAAARRPAQVLRAE